MKHIAMLTTGLALVIASPAFAQDANAPVKAATPDSLSVTAYYKQNVYDKSNAKIGEVMDVLVDQSGKVTGLVVGAGGFLGMGRHDVIVPFSSVKMMAKNDNTNNDNANSRRDNTHNDYLVMDATKDQLKADPAVMYDRTAMTWVADDGKNANASDNTTTRRHHRHRH